MTAVGLAMFAYTAVIGMGVCYLTWFATLRRLPPATASVGILLVPLIGIVSSALLIGEPLGPRELMAVALTLGGVTLALTGSRRRAKTLGQRPSSAAAKSGLMSDEKSSRNGSFRIDAAPGTQKDPSLR